MARWRVDLIGKGLKYLGALEAPNAQEAHTKAISLFRITPEGVAKLTITKIGADRGSSKKS
jgi:hypothetical protein